MPRNRAIGLSVLLECGAVYRELPSHAWTFSDTPSGTSDIQAAQAWDCFGGSAQVLEYRYLRELPVMVLQGGRMGSYLFTLEFAEDGFSRYPGQAMPTCRRVGERSADLAAKRPVALERKQFHRRQR